MINLRLAAICRLADEAADRGLLGSDLAAGIRGVEGVRRLGVRVGNWLTAEGGKKLLRAETASGMVRPKPKGTHRIRVYIDGGGYRVDQLEGWKLGRIATTSSAQTKTRGQP